MYILNPIMDTQLVELKQLATDYYAILDNTASTVQQRESAKTKVEAGISALELPRSLGLSLESFTKEGVLDEVETRIKDEYVKLQRVNVNAMTAINAFNKAIQEDK